MSVTLVLAGLLIAVWTVKRSFWLALYLLFGYSFVQNLVVPFMFTAGWISAATAMALILFKEILLLIMAVYALAGLSRTKSALPRAAKLLLVFTCYCALRGAISLANGDASTESLRILRQACYPIQILVVGLFASIVDRNRAVRFIKHNCALLLLLAAAALALFLSAGTDFWAKYVNIATYNVDVKGEEAANQVLDEGVSATGGGREEFSFLGNFRAMGSFGDPIALGFELSLPMLLLLFKRKRTKQTWFAISLFAATLFATLTRSAWIFTAVALLYVLVRKRRYALLLATVAVAGSALIVLAPLTEFVSTSIDKLVTQDPTDYHSQGITGFYAEALPDPTNVLGKGLDPSVQTVPESGYAYLLQHFGMPALVLFLLCHWSMFRELKDGDSDENWSLIAQGLVLGTLVTMHFSQYPMSFLAYLTIWFFLGQLLVSSRTVPVPQAETNLELGMEGSAL